MHTFIGGEESESNRPTIYAQILTEEDLKDKMLEHCKRESRAIVNLHSHLLPDYAFEAEELFRARIRAEADRAAARNMYAYVGGLLRTYSKSFGAERARAIGESLIMQYPRRRAMAEELRAVRY